MDRERKRYHLHYQQQEEVSHSSCCLKRYGKRCFMITKCLYQFVVLVYGYIRPARMYIPLTTYQTVHGRVGYQILDRPNVEVTGSVEVPTKSSTEQVAKEIKDVKKVALRNTKKDDKANKQKPVAITELDISKVLEKPEDKWSKLDNCSCALQRRR